MGSEIVVTDSVFDDVRPSVAMDAQGNFVVAWEKETIGQSPLQSDIMMARFSSAARRA